MNGLTKIISGAQTGADRAALDWAIFRDIPHGGWCPKGRKAEDGKIPPHYQLTETPSASYLQRTEWNVRDSDGTLIFTLSDKLSRGSAKTAFFAERHGKPFLHVHPGLSYQPAADVLRFVHDQTIKVLNIVGTRGSKEPYIGKFVKQVLEEAFFPRPQGARRRWRRLVALEAYCCSFALMTSFFALIALTLSPYSLAPEVFCDCKA